MFRLALLCAMIALLATENGISETIRFVRAATDEVTTYCDRNRETCDEVAERAAATGQWLADEGGAVAALVMARLQARERPSGSSSAAREEAGGVAADVERSMKTAPARNPFRGTLSDRDMRPGWRSASEGR